MTPPYKKTIPENERDISPPCRGAKQNDRPGDGTGQDVQVQPSGLSATARKAGPAAHFQSSGPQFDHARSLSLGGLITTLVRGQKALRNQACILTDRVLDLEGHRRIITEKLLCVLASLPNTLGSEGKPGP